MFRALNRKQLSYVQYFKNNSKYQNINSLGAECQKIAKCITHLTEKVWCHILAINFYSLIL